jgi:hypothetical protein
MLRVQRVPLRAVMCRDEPGVGVHMQPVATGRCEPYAVGTRLLRSVLVGVNRPFIITNFAHIIFSKIPAPPPWWETQTFHPLGWYALCGVLRL